MLPRIISATGSTVSADEIAAVQRVISTRRASGAGIYRITDQLSGVLVEYHQSKNTAYVTSKRGNRIIGRYLQAPVPADGKYYIDTNRLKYTATPTPTLTETKQAYAVGASTFTKTETWLGVPSQWDSAQFVIGATVFVDPATGRKNVAIQYLSNTTARGIQTANYDISTTYPTETSFFIQGVFNVKGDTFVVLQPATAGLSGMLVCSYKLGTAVQATSTYQPVSMYATQNAVWIIDGTSVQYVKVVAGVLTIASVGVGAISGAWQSVLAGGMTSVGGAIVPTAGTTIVLWQVTESGVLRTKEWASADVQALTGVPNSYGPQLLQVTNTDADIQAVAYWQQIASPFQIVGTTHGLLTSKMLVGLSDSVTGQMIDGGIVADGFYGLRYYAGSGGFAYDYTISIFDSAGVLLDISPVASTNRVSPNAQLVGSSARAAYFWCDDLGSKTLRRFDWATHTWSSVTMPSSIRVPSIFITPDVDFYAQLTSVAPAATTIGDTNSPSFSAAISGYSPSICYDPKSRTLMVAGKLAVMNVGRPGMTFISNLVSTPAHPTDLYQSGYSRSPLAAGFFALSNAFATTWDAQVATQQPK